MYVHSPQLMGGIGLLLHDRIHTVALRYFVRSIVYAAVCPEPKSARPCADAPWADCFHEASKVASFYKLDRFLDMLVHGFKTAYRTVRTQV
jgi:hypothetical protein